MHCAKCGHQHQETASFCIECGAPLVSAPDSTAVGGDSRPPLPSLTARSALRWALVASVTSYVLFAALLYWSPELRREFLAACECDMNQGIKSLAALFPVWLLVLWLGKLAVARLRG